MARSITDRRWFPTSQPQTLQIAVALLYWNAFLSLLAGLLAGGLGRLALLTLLVDVTGAYGVANERKWGYASALVAAALPFAFLIAFHGHIALNFFSLLFDVALVALLVHPASRGYYKIWFR